MPETPETEARITKMQKDIEELKEAMRDNLHERRKFYEGRVEAALKDNPDCVTLWLEIDGVRSVNEIEQTLVSEGRKIPHATLWRSFRRLLRAGLIRKVDVKGRSPVYSKKSWNKELNIDDYVRLRFFEKKSGA